MSYSNSFPSVRPTTFDFANSGKLDSRLSYTRSSTGTYMSSEKALNSENLLLQSQDFDTSWAANHISAPTGSQTAPDGTSTAWLLSAASGTGAPTLYQNASPKVSSNTSHTLICHVKAGTASHAYISFRGAPTESAYSVIDFASPLSPTSGGAVMTGISSSSVALGNGWYRLSLTFTTATISGGYSFIYIGTSDGTTPASNGYVSYDSTGDTMFAWGAQLSSTNSKVYDSPTTTQIAREYSPLLKTASANEPRFEYAADGQSVGTALGLLVESQATNICPCSRSLVDSGGTMQLVSKDSSIQKQVAIGPDGTLSALKLIADSSLDTHYGYINAATAPDGSSAYTVSCYAKAAGEDTLVIRLTSTYSAFSTAITGSFTLTGSGTAVAVGGTATAQITEVANGWYRCSVTETTASSPTGMRPFFYTRTINPAYNGNDYDGILLACFQIEKNSSPSSWIDTGTAGASASRAADSCSVVDATLFSSGEHTIIWEGDTDPTTSDKRFFALSDGSMNNRFVADYDNGTATRLRNWADGTNNVGMSTSTVDMTVGTHKLAATLKTNEAQLVVDGTRRQVDTSCVVGGGIDQIGINSSTTGAGPTYNMNGHCKRLTYYNVALSQAEAEALTSNP